MYLFFFVDGHRPHPFGNANMLPPQSLCQVSCGQPPSTLLWYYTYVLCKVILFSFLWTFTLRNLLPTVDVPRPRQCSYQEKYTTAISFKVAKALKNKLDSFSIYDSWESFCGMKLISFTTMCRRSRKSFCPTSTLWPPWLSH